MINNISTTSLSTLHVCMHTHDLPLHTSIMCIKKSMCIIELLHTYLCYKRMRLEV